jgi:hypothetical protein
MDLTPEARREEEDSQTFEHRIRLGPGRVPGYHIDCREWQSEDEEDVATHVTSVTIHHRKRIKRFYAEFHLGITNTQSGVQIDVTALPTVYGETMSERKFARYLDFLTQLHYQDFPRFLHDLTYEPIPAALGWPKGWPEVPEPYVPRTFRPQTAWSELYDFDPHLRTDWDPLNRTAPDSLNLWKLDRFTLGPTYSIRASVTLPIANHSLDTPTNAIVCASRLLADPRFPRLPACTITMKYRPNTSQD